MSVLSVTRFAHHHTIPHSYPLSQQASAPQLVSRKALGRVAPSHVARVLATNNTSTTLRQVPLEEARSPLSAPLPAGSDPWEDEKWSKYKWTIYRGVAYDLTPYLEKHPGGRWLLNLAVGRDATGLFESYHLRPEVAVARLNRLPKLEGFPIEAVPTSPYPNDSPIYNAIRSATTRLFLLPTLVDVWKTRLNEDN